MTAIASGRGPMVLRLSLVSSAACSHSRPSAVKVPLEASLPLGLRMKLPVTWFFTAGKGRGTDSYFPPQWPVTQTFTAFPGSPSSGFLSSYPPELSHEGHQEPSAD